MIYDNDITTLSHASGLDGDIIIDIINTVLSSKISNGTSRYSLNEVASDIVDGIGFLMEEKYPFPPSSEGKILGLVKSSLKATSIQWRS